MLLLINYLYTNCGEIRT